MSAPALAIVPDARPLPHSLDAERSVLGALLVYPSRSRAILDEIAALLCAGDFYDPLHGVLFAAMERIAAADRPIDTVTLEAQLQADGTLNRLRQRGAAYLAELTSAIPAVENVAHYARIVRGKAQRRRLIETAQGIAAKGYADEGSDEDYAREAEAEFLSLSLSSEGADYVPLKAALREEIANIERRYEAKSDVTGVPSGFAELDLMTSGFQPSTLAIIAARPSMGKTSLVLNAVHRAAERQGVPSLVFSLETSRALLARRLFAADGPIDSRRLGSGRLDSAQFIRLTRSAGRLSELPISLCDASDLTIAEIRRIARRWRAKECPQAPLASVVVDYLQLVRGSAKKKQQNREQEIAEISRELKAMAKEIRVPVIALSQLNRGLESREKDKRPRLSDLRESGQIEQDADLIAFIYRDEVYHPESKDKGTAEVIVAKQRDGDTGVVRLRFERAFTRFEDLADAAYSPPAYSPGDSE
jgi:replicative DNA helicase